MEIAGKGVFVTGGSRGIGRAIVEALLLEKARVVFCGLNEEIGKAVEGELQSRFGSDNVTFIKCDVSNADQVTATWETVVLKLGGVDVCVNNAGVSNDKNWEKMIAVNQVGTIRLSLLALKHMRRDKGGRGGVIINMASVAGLLSFPYVPVYAATKHAIVAFTTSWAKSLQNTAHGVRWAVVCPFAVITDILNDEEDGFIDQERLNSKFMRPPLIETKDVAVAFINLLKDENSNGAILEVSQSRGGVYRQRQITDADGKSNLWLADSAFEDPPYI